MNQRALFVIILILMTLSSSCSNHDLSDIQTQQLKNMRPSEEKVQNEKFEGIYRFGTDAESGPVGSITLYQQNDSTALFYLDICRGAPSYNLGQVLGKINIIGNTGIYNGDCILHFKLKDKNLTIRTDNEQNECGFGHAVYADQIYTSIDESKPKFFINGQSDTTYFEGLTVEKYYNFD